MVGEDSPSHIGSTELASFSARAATYRQCANEVNAVQLVHVLHPAIPPACINTRTGSISI
jgi:hypothetical protein